MKRFTLILLTVLMAAACRKVSPDQRIVQISKYFDKTDNTYVEDLQRFDNEKRLDYLTLTIAKELNAADIFTIEHADAQSLVAQFPGREKKQMRYSILSASLDDPEACAVALSTLKALKDLKLKPNGTIHALFYSNAVDTAGVSGLDAVFQDIRDSEEQITFELELTTRDSLARHTFVIEDKEFFADQLIEVVPPYMAKLGTFQFRKGRYPNREWPIKAPVYRYSTDPTDLRKEAAAITLFSLLLN